MKMGGYFLSFLLLSLICWSSQEETTESLLPDYYAILGILPSSSPHHIKRTFRILALRYHPDRNADPDSQLMFMVISEAYAVLDDPEGKKEYDFFHSQIYPEQHGPSDLQRLSKNLNVASTDDDPLYPTTSLGRNQTSSEEAGQQEVTNQFSDEDADRKVETDSGRQDLNTSTSQDKAAAAYEDKAPAGQDKAAAADEDKNATVDEEKAAAGEDKAAAADEDKAPAGQDKAAAAGEDKHAAAGEDKAAAAGEDKAAAASEDKAAAGQVKNVGSQEGNKTSSEMRKEPVNQNELKTASLDELKTAGLDETSTGGQEDDNDSGFEKFFDTFTKSRWFTDDSLQHFCSEKNVRCWGPANSEGASRSRFSGSSPFSRQQQQQQQGYRSSPQAIRRTLLDWRMDMLEDGPLVLVSGDQVLCKHSVKSAAGRSEVWYQACTVYPS